MGEGRGEGGREGGGESSSTADFKREDTPGGGCSGQQRQSPITGSQSWYWRSPTPQPPVAAGNPGSSWFPPRSPPVRAGGLALQCHCECERGRKLRYLRSPFHRARAAAAGHNPAKSPLPRGRRCRVAHPWRELNMGLAEPSRVQFHEGLRRVAEVPGSGRSPFPRPVGAVAAPRSRRKARRSHGHGCRRVSGGSAGLGREGLPLPARPRARGVRRCRLDPRLRCARQARMAPGQFQPRPAVSFTCTHRALPHPHPPPTPSRSGHSSEVVGSRVCHLQDPKSPTPASRQAVTSRIGPCFSSRTITTPPLPAIFLGGHHLQRF